MWRNRPHPDRLMGSEVCPFCGKTYKRLKSHLPHCKAAASSRPAPAPAPAPVAATRTPASELAAAPPRNRSKEVSAGSPAAAASSPPSAKKTKQKLSEQIMASTASQARKKSLRALTEADTKVSPDPLTKPRDAPKQNLPQIKRREAAECLSTTQRASDGHAESRNSLRVDSEGEAGCLSVNELLMNSRSDQGRITLQDVKAALRRGKASGRSSALSIASHHEAASGLRSPPQQAASIPLQRDASLPFSLPPDQAAPLSPTISTSEGLKVGHRVTRLLPVSAAPTHNPSPHAFQQAPAVGVEALRAGEGVATERLQLKVRKENTAEGALTQRRLGQVRLRELPQWLACRTPTTPRDAVDMVHRGWQWYHRTYIDVRKGGAGGVAMLLVGYCVLSYAWSYPHVKRDRWRKHH